jgi:hypothetical protein
MSPTRPTFRIRPRSGIADASLARGALTDLAGSRPVSTLRRRDLRSVILSMRSRVWPQVPERMIVMSLATAKARRP